MSVSVLVRANPHISFLSVSPVAASRCLRSLVEAADRPLLPNLQAVWVTQSRPRWRPEPPRAGAQLWGGGGCTAREGPEFNSVPCVCLVRLLSPATVPLLTLSTMSREWLSTSLFRWNSHAIKPPL